MQRLRNPRRVTRMGRGLTLPEASNANVRQCYNGATWARCSLFETNQDTGEKASMSHTSKLTAAACQKLLEHSAGPARHI